MGNFQVSNPIVNQLIKQDRKPNHDLLKNLTQIPREQLISDLENVLKHILNDKNPGRQSLIGIHALFYLTELKSTTSLPILINLFEQEDDFLYFHFDEHITETMWQDVFILGQENITDLFTFLGNTDLENLAVYPIVTGLVQIALHLPERKAQIIEGFKNLLNYLFSSNSEFIFDSHDNLGHSIRELKSAELESIIKLFYDTKRMSGYGTWKDYLSEAGKIGDAKIPLLTLDERYEHMATPDIDFDNKLDKLRSAEPKTLEELNDLDLKTEALFASRGINLKDIIVNEPISRNSPCPCGSGKKYKRCCGKN